VALRVANREQVLRALTSGEADLAVMGRPPDLAGWSSRAIMSNELVAIAFIDHPRVGGPAVRALDLASETFFLREPGSGTRLAVEAFLRDAGMPIDDDAVLGSDSAIKQAVMAGLGVSILSRQAIDLELAAGRLAILPVDGLPLPREWFLVEPSDAVSPATQAFSRYLRDAIG
jgi:DNA-binding transcriptional LysR family regulator